MEKKLFVIYAKSKVGQNAYWGGSSVESEEAAVQAGMINAAQAWYDEVSDPGFDSGSISPYVFSSGTGHYTQVHSIRGSVEYHISKGRLKKVIFITLGSDPPSRK